MSPGRQAVIYARVSSEQQAEAKTIESQLAALRARVAAEGLSLPAEMEFVDEGYSGATLIRPSLERLRDLVAAGGVDRLYVHSPDRLSRKYAYQVLLVDEFQRGGVEVIFLNRELGQTPEDDLLLQGMVAEYERAKILERSRRGKRYAAHSGAVSVLSTAPYGYRYVNKQDGGGQARLEIIGEQARVVRQIFEWVGKERATIGEVCRRLQQAKETTRTGKEVWDRSTVWGILKNPAYIGSAAFGKTRTGPLRPRLRAQRGRNLQPRRAYSSSAVPTAEWISIPVPALVAQELFETVQQQLRDNRRRARQRQRGARYLLQGLVTCKQCGYAYYGKPVSQVNRSPRTYAYYRCIGTDAYRFGGERVCGNTQVRTDSLDAAVWREVCTLLNHPSRLEQEYRRRLQPQLSGKEADRLRLEAQLGKLRQGLARLIDSYAEGLLDKSEVEPRILRLKERIQKLEQQIQQATKEASLEAELRLIIGHLEDFSAKVKSGVQKADWLSRRDLIRGLVKRVEVDRQQVKIVFRVGPDPFEPGPERGILQHCWRGARSTMRKHPLLI
jgi:site-specific DNA recombinase